MYTWTQFTIKKSFLKETYPITLLSSSVTNTNLDLEWVPKS